MNTAVFILKVQPFLIKVGHVYGCHALNMILFNTHIYHEFSNKLTNLNTILIPDVLNYALFKRVKIIKT